MEIWIIGTIFSVITLLLGIFIKIAFGNLNSSVKTLEKSLDEIKEMFGIFRADIAENYVAVPRMVECRREMREDIKRAGK